MLVGYVTTKQERKSEGDGQWGFNEVRKVSDSCKFQSVDVLITRILRTQLKIMNCKWITVD